MRNIHVLSTDKPSRLTLGLQSNALAYTPIKIGTTPLTIPQNIYVTNDEEIKRWFLDTVHDVVEDFKFLSKGNLINGCWVKSSCKKIILTTDQELIADNVQAIPDEFLEWFVKNPSCEEVEVENIILSEGISVGYEIEIPKKEPITLGKIIPKERVIGLKEPKQRLEKYSERFDFSLYRNIQVLPLEFSKWFEQFKNK